MSTTECTMCAVETTHADGICRFCADYTPPQLTHPTDAVEVDGWKNTDGDDTTVPPFRMFTGTARTIPAANDTSMGWVLSHGDTIVQIEGVQFSNGRVKRWVEIAGDITLLPPEQVGVLADMLVSARNEIM
ncbi:hypothetical protein, partial [Mycolicibacterium fortuitum]